MFMSMQGTEKKKPFVPRYQRIYEDLKAKILDGTYGEGARLPIEHALCEQYGVERITVRKALELLVQDELIVKHAGVGSFVRSGQTAREASSASNTLLFVMHRNTNDIRSNPSAFNSMLFFAVEKAAKGFGYSLQYVGITQEDDVMELVRRSNACGVFLVSTLPREVIDALVRANIPCICLNHFDDRLIAVVPDNVCGVYDAVTQLCLAGHRRVGFIGGIAEAVNAAERYEGYRRALIDAGYELDLALVQNGTWTYESGRMAMQRLLELDSRPTAVFGASDMMAIGAMEAIRNAGLRIPEDVSVIGFDGTDACKFCVPQLTSVTVDPEQMARVACEHLDMLVKREARQADHYVIRLKCRLVNRHSAPGLRRE